MRLIFLLILICSNLNLMTAQTASAPDLIVNVNLPSFSSLSINTSDLVSRKFNSDFSNVKVNTNYQSIKEGNLVMSKEAFLNYNQFDYEVFKHTPADALRRITPNFDLHSAPLPSPTYYSVD